MNILPSNAVSLSWAFYVDFLWNNNMNYMY